MTETSKTIAIVGAGPRGLAALEALCLSLETQQTAVEIKILIFEPSDFPGAGQIWSPAQVETNLSNIHERHIAEGLQPRPEINFQHIKISAFPGYARWANYHLIKRKEPDYFPPRAKLGAYLHERFRTMSSSLQACNRLQLINETVVDLKIAVSGCRLTTSGGTEYTVAEVLLCIGHQPVYDSKQLQRWETHALRQELQLYKDPYPVGALETEKITSDTVVALRGFGLSMIDQIRALSIGFGGNFIEIPGADRLQYEVADTAPETLVAFSLDGLPPAPKPKNPEIDSWFEPSAEAMKTFKNQIIQANCKAAQLEDANFLVEAIGEMTASVYITLKQKARPTALTERELAQLTTELIQNPEDFEHGLHLSHDLPAVDALNALLDMACARALISLDYCLGQVWRFALDVLYHDFNDFDFSDAVMVDMVGYIEASKRYSYGPPIVSVQQLLALVDAGVLNLNFVENPKIELVPQGWKLSKNNRSVTAGVMVNSVIDPAQLLRVSSPLIEHLREAHQVNVVASKLGLHTLEDGRIISKGGNTHQPVALLGRLAKGSVIGVDDLIECFGKSAQKWASGVVGRLES